MIFITMYYGKFCSLSLAVIILYDYFEKSTLLSLYILENLLLLLKILSIFHFTKIFKFSNILEFIPLLYHM